jgi:5-methyltetrahydropteroyltriglutamate--homocysteine methyltransferase
MWDPERSRAAYPTREAFMRALAPVLRAELLAVKAAGVTVAQFDDPHLCLLADPNVRADFADPDAEAALCVDLLNEIMDGVDGIVTAVHLCRRNKGRQGWIGEGAMIRSCRSSGDSTSCSTCSRSPSRWPAISPC